MQETYTINARDTAVEPSIIVQKKESTEAVKRELEIFPVQICWLSCRSLEERLKEGYSGEGTRTREPVNQL